MVGYFLAGLAQDYSQLLAYRFLGGLFGSSGPIASAVYFSSLLIFPCSTL
jgi:hypothetical protein